MKKRAHRTTDWTNDSTNNTASTASSAADASVKNEPTRASRMTQLFLLLFLSCCFFTSHAKWRATSEPQLTCCCSTIFKLFSRRRRRRQRKCELRGRKSRSKGKQHMLPNLSLFFFFLSLFLRLHLSQVQSLVKKARAHLALTVNQPSQFQRRPNATDKSIYFLLAALKTRAQTHTVRAH